MKGFGFKAIPECGSIADKSFVLYKDTAVIGLFEGMFESNILTFNPADVRTIEKYLKDNDIKIDTPTHGESGPAHCVLKEHDGNTIMFDQIYRTLFYASDEFIC
jgi:hypothetical protein